jgi:hypothetical protein
MSRSSDNQRRHPNARYSQRLYRRPYSPEQVFLMAAKLSDVDGAPLDGARRAAAQLAMSKVVRVSEIFGTLS